MTGTLLLDATIGVVFVILSFSLIASALSEALATALNWRGRMLRRGLFRLLEGPASGDLIDRAFPGAARIGRAQLTRQVLADPAIQVLHGPRGTLSVLWDRVRGRAGEGRPGRLPSAIPAESFARALVDTLARQVELGAAAAGEPPSAALARRLAAKAGRDLRAPDGPLARIALSPDLKARLGETVADLAAVREIRARSDGAEADQLGEIAALADRTEARLSGLLQDLGTWFERAMERVSGWYARRTRLALFLLGAVLAASVNTDLTELAGRMRGDPGLRHDLIRQAERRAETGLPQPRPATEVETVDTLAAEIDAAHESLTTLPGFGGPGLGWSCGDREQWWVCFRRGLHPSGLISWVLIGLGCMMGGRFWYELLGVVLRFRPADGAVRRTGPV